MEMVTEERPCVVLAWIENIGSSWRLLRERVENNFDDERVQNDMDSFRLQLGFDLWLLK
jgi:hypothetical protein